MHFRKVLKQTLSVFLCSVVVFTSVPEFSLFAKADNNQVTSDEDIYEEVISDEEIYEAGNSDEDNYEEVITATETALGDILDIEDEVVEQAADAKIDAVAPSIKAFATEADLTDKTKFSLWGEDGGVAQKVKFGNGKTWYIAGADKYKDENEVEKVSLVLMCDPENPLAEDYMFFNYEDKYRDYETSYGNYLYEKPSKVDVNHYGASDIRKYLKNDALNSFSTSEKALMNQTKIFTPDQNNKLYFTLDELYLAYGYYPNNYITVGSNDYSDLEKGIKIGINGTTASSGSPYTRFSTFMRNPVISNYDDAGYNDGYYVHNVSYGQVYYEGGVTYSMPVVPAFNLKMSTILFASTLPSAPDDGSAPNTTFSDTMTFRVDGTDAIKSSADIYYDTLQVTKGTGDNEYIYILYNDGVQDKLFTEKITESTKYSCSKYGLNSFDNCKIWIEKFNRTSHITYAKMAAVKNIVIYDNMIYELFKIGTRGSVRTKATLIAFVRDYYQNATEVEAIIPEYVEKDGEKYTVTEIADEALNGRKKLTNVYIPDTVTKMETTHGGFSNCEKLVSVRLSNKMNKLTDGSFYKCSKLSSIIIPETWDDIPRLMFAGAESLSEITIPASVKKIGENAFLGAGVSDGITINYGAAKEEWDVLISDENCAAGNDVLKAENVKINFAHQHYFVVSSTDKSKHKCKYCDVIQEHDFSKNGTCVCRNTQVVHKVIDGTKTVKITGPNTDISMTGNLVIPSTVKIDGEDYTVVEIASNAFEKCSFTDNLIIPDSVTVIGSGAFENAKFTGSLTLPNGIKYIKKTTFKGCKFSGDLVIPDSVENIAGDSFNNSGFTGKLTISKNVKYIYDRAFVGCGFTGDVFIPDSTITIIEDIFKDCNNINTISFSCKLNVSLKDKMGIDAEKVIQRNHTLKIKSYDNSKHSCSVCYFTEEHDFLEQPYHLTDDKTQHYKICNGCEAKVKSDHTRTELINVKAATCTEEGYSGDTYCNECENIIKTGKKLEATAHSKTELINVKAATCTEPGYSGDTYCVDCKTIIKPGEKTETAGHKFDDVVTKAPTYDEEGEKLCTCSVCKATEKKVIDKLVRPETPVTIGDSSYKLVQEAMDADGKPLPAVDLSKAIIVKGNKVTFAKASDMKLEGYTFKGFYANNKKVKSLKANKLKDGMVITARYVENTYTVAYKLTKPAKGVKIKGKIKSYKAKYTEEITINDGSQITAEGYKIVGWTKSKKGTEADYAAGTTTSSMTGKNKGKVTLYPIWEKLE